MLYACEMMCFHSDLKAKIYLKYFVVFFTIFTTFFFFWGGGGGGGLITIVYYNILVIFFVRLNLTHIYNLKAFVLTFFITPVHPNLGERQFAGELGPCSLMDTTP